jgi:hypothetical protein
MDTDYTPISWNKPLMRVKARIYPSNTVFDDKFVTLLKRTGNTIKDKFTSFNPKTGKTCYGSHRHQCWSCSPSVKSTNKRNTYFKRHTVSGEINDNINDY